MISKSFGLLFYLKKHHGDTKVYRPIYLRITVDGVMKEMSIHRSYCIFMFYYLFNSLRINEKRKFILKIVHIIAT